MGIKLKEPADEHVAIFEEILSEFSSIHVLDVRYDGAEGESAVFSFALPIPFYQVSPNDLLEGRFLAESRLVGSKYLLLDGDEPIATMELRYEYEDERPRFGGINGGPLTQGIVSSLVDAERFAQTQEGDYELRLIEFPALYFVGMWLHSDADMVEDRIIVLSREAEWLMDFPVLEERYLIPSLREKYVARVAKERKDCPPVQPN